MKAMKPRPFYRWKSFWLGLFVLCFLGWAWADSFKSETSVRLTSSQAFLLASRGEGGTIFITSENSGIQPIRAHWGRGALTKGFTRLTEELSRVSGRSYSRLSDAAVFVSSFALWSAWLFLHWKREQKKSL